LALGKVQKVVPLSVIRPRLDVPYAVPLIGFDAYPILADADEIGVLPIDDIGSTFLARDVEASAICPNSTDMRDGLMRIMRVGLSDAGYLISHYGLMCSAGRGAGVSITATRFFTAFCTFSKAHTPIWRTRSRETPNSSASSLSVIGSWASRRASSALWKFE